MKSKRLRSFADAQDDRRGAVSRSSLDGCTQGQPTQLVILSAGEAGAEGSYAYEFARGIPACFACTAREGQAPPLRRGPGFRDRGDSAEMLLFARRGRSPDRPAVITTSRADEGIGPYGVDRDFGIVGTVRKSHVTT